MNCEFQTIDETHSTHGEQISNWRERSVDVDLGLLLIARGKAHQRSFRMDARFKIHHRALQICQSVLHKCTFLAALLRDLSLEVVEILLCNHGLAVRRDNNTICVQGGDVSGC